MTNKKNKLKTSIFISTIIFSIFIVFIYNNQIKPKGIVEASYSSSLGFEDNENIKTLISFGGKSDGISDNKMAFENAASWLRSKNAYGKKLIIPPGRYFTSERINFSNIKNCNIECLGEILSVKGIIISGDEITATFKKITGDTQSEVININNNGLYITATTNSTFTIGTISGYKNAVMLVGDALLTPKGVIYTTIDVGKVTHSDTGCLVTTINNPALVSNEIAGYVNENTLRVRWMDTNYGIKFQKGFNQKDRFNNNKIEYAGLEHIANDGITMEFSTRNLIYEPRNEDVKGLTFKETESYINKYIVSVTAIADKVVLDRGVSYYGVLTDKNGSPLCQMFFKDANGKPNYYTPGGFESFYNRSGSLKYPTNILNVYAISNPIEVTMEITKEYEGSTFYINAITKNKTITIKNSNNQIDIPDIGNGVGVYLLIYYGDRWHSTKLSDIPFTQ